MSTAPNPWLERKVLCYGHRGGAKEAPSSTLAAMFHALEAGADAIELDVHSTSDGHLVCCHDETVDRTTNGRGAIAQMTLGELKELDAAWWFVEGYETKPDLSPDQYLLRGKAAKDPLYRIPTLQEVLEAFPDVLLNLDIKRTAPQVIPYEELLASQLRQYGRTDDVIVASFSQQSLAAFSAASPEIHTAASPGETAQLFQAVLHGLELVQTKRSAFQVPHFMAGAEVPTPEFVEAAHTQGAAVHVWTVDDPASLENLVHAGVDGIMTDAPTPICEELNRLGVRYQRQSE